MSTIKVKITTKLGIFDCEGILLYSGKNNKNVYLNYPIGANNKYVYVIKSDKDNQIRGFYKKEIISLEYL